MSLLTQFYNCSGGGGGGGTANEAIGNPSPQTVYAILTDGTVACSTGNNFNISGASITFGPTSIPSSVSLIKEIYALNVPAGLNTLLTYSNYTGLEKLVVSNLGYTTGATTGIRGNPTIKTIHIGTLNKGSGPVIGVGVVDFSNNPSLTDFKLGGILLTNATTLTLDVSNCSLSQSSVDGVLINLVLAAAQTSAINSGSTINLGGTGNAAPSALGVTYRNILTAAPFNATVLTN